MLYHMRMSLFLVIFLLIVSYGCDRKQPVLAQVSTNERLIESNIRTLIDSCWNNQDIAQLMAISAENFTKYLNGIKVVDTQKEMQSHMNVFFDAFPDLRIELNQLYIEEGKVFMHWTAAGTNTGVFGEVAATGKKMKVSGLSHFYFDEKGKLLRENAVYNELDLLQQLGYTLNPPNLE